MGPPRALVASEAPSIFSARWFQLLLGGLTMLLITVLAVPYLVVRGMTPLTSAGRASGIVTELKRRQPPAPATAAASRKAGLKVRSAADVERKT